ncbi:hypothetical protein CLV28_1355 [Sediminihabitans luteus]|uniref:DUF4145 domain-containing protein n=1 Tax=Sediminihabitans luteus TaxID=1138585 RepID=A0A2M9CPP1_9CELL|nr:hypothetical protein [Sediminihabitans luteus]PJJ73872.1 hypothetical protein CLV28_1355 [Sediminihabitans luteus]GII98216.1 hypothetical protein Slu03_05940 [Sediminihabitans luteus]
MQLDFPTFHRQVTQEENLLTMYLKGHLWVERSIDEALRLLFPNPDALSTRLTFAQKVNLIDAFGLFAGKTETVLNSVRSMSKRRNELAHRLEVVLDAELLEEIAEALRANLPGASEPDAPTFDNPRSAMSMWFFVMVTMIEYAAAARVYAQSKLIDPDLQRPLPLETWAQLPDEILQYWRS